MRIKWGGGKGGSAPGKGMVARLYIPLDTAMKYEDEARERELEGMRAEPVKTHALMHVAVL